MKAYLFRPHNMGKKSCDGIAQFSKSGISVVQSGVDMHPSGPHLCIRWGCTSSVPSGRNVLNKLENMKLTMNKGKFRRQLQEAELCPPSWGWGWGAAHSFPCVVRPGFHAKAKDFHLCANKAEMDKAINMLPDAYCSKFIEKKAEYRVNVLQGRVLSVIEKSPENKDDLTWSRGTTSILYWSEWDIDVVKKAVAAVKLSGLDFAGVDVIMDKNDKAYVLELNTLPFLEGSYQQQCYAKGFDWVVENGREHIDPKGAEDWKRYVHPCMSTLARV